MKPLEGIQVLDFSQFLSGPSAALRLADLGARVIKIENPNGGDICRSLYISNMEVDGDSTLFHAINRNKESYAVNLKSPEGLANVQELIRQSDVVIQNFRPGVMKRLGLDYETVRQWNPQLVYAEITGYGTEGPWVHKPGQDLLVQSYSGITWLNGYRGQPPLPFGLSVADMLAGALAVQGILACLVRRGITGKGGHIEVSLLEAILDFQFEVLSTHLNDGGRLPVRGKQVSGHTYGSSVQGIYETSDGFLALGVGSIDDLGEAIDCPSWLFEWNAESAADMERRESMLDALAEHLRNDTTEAWLRKLESTQYPCSRVYTWDQLLEQEGFRTLQMVQRVYRGNGVSLLTTRCPIRIDGEYFLSDRGAPAIGEHSPELESEFGLQGAARPSSGL